ncbi:hypothetical protein [Anaerobranca gottschalkii]|uniref:Uncharacterized protein n=1 Tax=Anaerobranca gottschalkii DSM 13577 TaxID=1120990 RepID=A0A1I0BAS2_9FIRM|nr:hypothetical protein [Anaerobranca gottschalkii]SET03197.1 hypothetical protein SAMN03080614_103413 [Anaerobranca gottschalkii DSM 13577]
MMYLEGGFNFRNGWWNSVTTVSVILDVSIALCSLGKSIKTGAALRNLLQSNAGQVLTRKLRSEIIRLFGSTAGRVFTAAISVLGSITGYSIGNMIALAIDRVDQNPNNGYLFG